VGVLIYEMLVSHTPFFGQGDIMDMYQRIIRGHVKYPPHVTSDARELLAGLLIVRPTMRLGCTKQGADAIKAHPWFASLDWEALEGRRLAAPMKIKDSDVSSLAHFACKVEQGEIAPYEDDGTNWDKAF
jgi:cGMP-dependent protein kinase 2